MKCKLQRGVLRGLINSILGFMWGIILTNQILCFRTWPWACGFEYILGCTILIGPVKLHVPWYRGAEPCLVPCKTTCSIVQGRRTLLDPPVIGSIFHPEVLGNLYLQDCTSKPTVNIVASMKVKVRELEGLAG